MTGNGISLEPNCLFYIILKHLIFWPLKFFSSLTSSAYTIHQVLKRCHSLVNSQSPESRRFLKIMAPAPPKIDGSTTLYLFACTKSTHIKKGTSVTPFPHPNTHSDTLLFLPPDSSTPYLICLTRPPSDRLPIVRSKCPKYFRSGCS